MGVRGDVDREFGVSFDHPQEENHSGIRLALAAFVHFHRTRLHAENCLEFPR
jgi:hypothetical protein